MKSNQQVQSGARRFSKTILLLALILLGVVVAFIYISQEIVIEKEHGFDNAVLAKVANLKSATATAFLHGITFFGSRAFLLPTYIVLVVLLLWYKQWRMAISIASVAMAGAGILYLLKDIFQRARPEDPLLQKLASFSYPSGHSFSIFTFAGILMYLVWNTRWKPAGKITAYAFLFAFALLVAFSRIYLRVHYPSDVLAGFCVSLLWLSLSFVVLRKARLL